MRRLLLTTAIAGAALVMSGCDPAPVYSPPPTPTAAPIFDSEEEALAAAEETWTAYLAALSETAQGGGENIEAFEGLVTAEQLESEKAYAAALVRTGRHLQGEFTTFNFHLQQYDTSEVAIVYLQAYACLDGRDTAYVYDDGRVAGNTAVAPVEVLLEADLSAAFLIAEVREWTGRDFCAAP